jgi:hypothetical protein
VLAEGRLQRDGIVMHLVADRLTDLTPRLVALLPEGGEWTHRSRDFH